MMSVRIIKERNVWESECQGQEGLERAPSIVPLITDEETKAQWGEPTYQDRDVGQR